MKFITLLCTLLYIASLSHGQLQNFTYNTANDSRCGGGQACDFTDPTIWVGNVSPTTMTNGNCSIWIATSSYVNIIVNSSTFTPYFLAIHVSGNVSFTIAGNMSAKNHYVSDQVQVNITSGGIIYGRVAYFTDLSQVFSSGGIIDTPVGFYGETKGQLTMINTAVIANIFMAPYLTCVSCDVTCYTLYSSVLNFSGTTTGGISDSIPGTIGDFGTTNIFVDVPYIDGDITVSSGSAVFFNATIKGDISVDQTPYANITFEQCNVQAGSILASRYSNIHLSSTFLRVNYQITGASFSYSLNSSIIFYCSGSVVNIQQADPNDQTAQLTVYVYNEAGTFYFDGTVYPFYLPSSTSLQILYGTTLEWLGNITVAATEISGTGVLEIGGSDLYPSTVTFLSPLFSSSLTLQTTGATLTAPAIEVFTLYVADQSTFNVANINISYLDISDQLHVNGNMRITEEYKQHLVKGSLQVSGSLVVQGQINLIEDDYNVLYDLNSQAGSSVIATALQISNSASYFVTEYDAYFYEEENFEYTGSTTNTEIILSFTFSDDPYTPPYDPDNDWFYNYWKWYLIFFIVISVISALVRIMFIYQRNRVGYARIN